MNPTHRQQRVPNSTDLQLQTPEIRAALDELAKAGDYARRAQCDPWEFAVEIGGLVGMGVTVSDLRWLVKQGIVEHAHEVTRPGDPARRFERSENLAFTDATCFLLVSRESSDRDGQYSVIQSVSSPNGDDEEPAVEREVPRWDSEDRTLCFAGQVIKEFRVPSPNQEAILAAFEEEGWPSYVDDPLSPVGEQNPKARLRDTIKCLNARHKNRLIRFRGDGTGERVRWQPLD